MTTLYLLSESAHFPGEVLFNGCFDQLFTIRRMIGVNTLIQDLEQKRIPQKTLDLRAGDEQLLVVLALPAEKTHATVLQLKSVMPTLVCIALLEAKDEKEVRFFDWDCLFLERPLNELHVKSVVAAALKQGNLLQQLDQISYVDGRSGLYSQRYFINRLTNELALAKRHEDTLSCVVFGLRYYDMYLDCFGYGFIEQLFRYLGENLKQYIRQEDVIARLGDDEIGLLLPRSAQEGAQLLANRIIENVAQKPFQYLSESETIELCAGVFGYVQNENTDILTLDADQAIRYARHALHQAKKQDEGTALLFQDLYPLS